MAEPGRTVRVSGLPVDIGDDRLKDKLLIHFMRSRNGGGEIESVNIVKATAVSALITFEDSRVAQSVIQHSRHILEVDGKTYKLFANGHHERLDPDKVIQSLTAMVDYSQLPGGMMALRSLHKSHPDILIHYDAAVKLHTLQGAYSKVQAALAQLLDNPESPLSAEDKDSGQPATDGSRSVQIEQAPHTQGSEDQSRKANKQRKEKVHTGRSSDECNPGPYRDITPGGYGLKATGQTEDSALLLAGPPTTSEEVFSLIVDADMFQYLQKNYGREYQQILRQYGVDVFHTTSQGLTTLFIQVATGKGEEGQNQECLKSARKAICVFLQENETNIRRDQFPKRILSPRGGLQRVKDNLSVRLPKVLLNEDDKNIYVTGSSSDVSEAMQFLLDLSKMWPNKEDEAGGVGLPSQDSGSSTHANEQRAPLTMPPCSDSTDLRIDHLVGSVEDERRTEAAGRYKLAARLKDSGLAALGSRPTDFSLCGGLLSPSRQTRVGPVLGRDVLSETAEIPGDRASGLFKNRDALPSPAYMQNITSITPHLFDTHPKDSASHLGTTGSSLPGSAPFPPAGSRFNLKRANSFSGMPQLKAQAMHQKSQDDTGNARVRAQSRSSSFSNETGRDKQGNHNPEMTVSFVMWQHMKDAYSARVDALTSDVQIKESRFEGSSDVTITLRGANSSKVTSCQQGLQKLFDSVSTDFSVLEIPLSELGITDTANETLLACCTEVHNQFKTVTIQIFKKSLHLHGSKQLCSKVGASLREIFTGDLAQIHAKQDSAGPSTSNWDPSTFLPSNGDPSTSLHSNPPQVMLESQTCGACGTVSSQERRANYESAYQETEPVNASIIQSSLRKDPVIKEKVKIVGAMARDRQKTDTFAKHSKTENDKSARRANGVGSTTTCPDKGTTLHTSVRTKRPMQKDSPEQRRAESDTPVESKSGLGSPGCICVCGETDISMRRTKCGATMCSRCLDTVHVYCRVCHGAEPTPRGIQGEMSHSELHVNLPGHKTDSAIKITYFIPDGIQEEGHPSPGKPFQGGAFEAFLPNCEKARKMLPRLEKAFRKGLTFTVVEKGTTGRVAWDSIPHKTRLQGGKLGNGYPDSSYLTCLSEVLTSHGIEGQPAKS